MTKILSDLPQSDADLEAEAGAKSAFRQSSAVKQLKDPEQAVFGLHDPATYGERYRAPEPITLKSPLGMIFMDGKNKHLEPLVSRTPREVLPGMFSFDHEVLHFLRELSSEADKRFPVDLDDEGFTRTGVHAGFAKLRCPAGYMQSPMSAKSVDNASIREELGLTAGYSPRQRQIALMVWKLVWSQARPSRVNVPKASAGGMRRMTHSVQWKVDYAQWKTQPAAYDKFLSLVERGESEMLANEFECCWGMYIQKRLQLDAPDKVRLANDWAYALSGGARGTRSPTDKKVILPDGSKWDDFSALRVRVIDAGPWSINCDLQMVASSHMQSLFVRWPKTFHVNTAEQIVQVVDGKHVYCSDVSEYDQSMSKDAIAVVFETMREQYPEGVCRSAERLYQAPYYAKPLSLDGTRGNWVANPLDWNFNMNSGNRSGHAFTSLVAKVNKVIETLFLFDFLYPVTERSIMQYLKGDMPIGLVNNGDDEIVWTVTQGDMNKFKLLRSDRTLGHYAVSPEDGQGFSGLLLVRPDPGQLRYVPTAKLQTPIEKCYVPERSIGTMMRRFWPVGWFDRIDSLHTSDAGRAMWDLHNFAYRKHLEPKYGKLMSLLGEGIKTLPISTTGLTAIDREVLADPSKLHYKYPSSDVSDKVLNLITSNIPATYVEGWLRRYYKGTFI